MNKSKVKLPILKISGHIANEILHSYPNVSKTKLIIVFSLTDLHEIQRIQMHLSEILFYL